MKARKKPKVSAAKVARRWLTREESLERMKTLDQWRREQLEKSPYRDIRKKNQS